MQRAIFQKFGNDWRTQVRLLCRMHNCHTTHVSVDQLSRRLRECNVTTVTLAFHTNTFSGLFCLGTLQLRLHGLNPAIEDVSLALEVVELGLHPLVRRDVDGLSVALGPREQHGLGGILALAAVHRVKSLGLAGMSLRMAHARPANVHGILVTKRSEASHGIRDGDKSTPLAPP